MTKVQYQTQPKPSRLYYFEFETKIRGKYFLSLGVLEKIGHGWYRYYFKIDNRIVWKQYPSVNWFKTGLLRNKDVRKLQIFELK